MHDRCPVGAYQILIKMFYRLSKLINYAFDVQHAPCTLMVSNVTIISFYEQTKVEHFIEGIVADIPAQSLYRLPQDALGGRCHIKNAIVRFLSQKTHF